MKAIAISRKEAGDPISAFDPLISDDAFHLVISITDPYLPEATIRTGTNNLIHRLRFLDTRSPTRAMSFTKEMAEGVWRFVLVYPEDILVVCHCEYGISRSSGMASAIMAAHGLPTDHFFNSMRYDPNTLVYDTMLQCFPGRPGIAALRSNPRRSERLGG